MHDRHNALGQRDSLLEMHSVFRRLGPDEAKRSLLVMAVTARAKAFAINNSDPLILSEVHWLVELTE
jgi:hypothetical protein